MAHFRGTITGSQDKEISRLGHKSTGLITEANGWDIGIRVEMSHNKETGYDEATVFLTSGSNHRESDKRIETFTHLDLGHLEFDVRRIGSNGEDLTL